MRALAEQETGIEGALERGVFTLSLDFELIWGTQDLFGPEGFRAACMTEREVIVGRLLDLLVEFDIQATWCVVGHLFLDRCEMRNGSKHPEIIRPDHAWYQKDWFANDPCTDERRDPIFYGSDLIQRIASCPVPQEIGCHSFSHVIFGDRGCSRAAAESEVAACVNLARERGFTLRSFVFPRNLVGHLDVLREYGFSCYRGPEPHWYEKRELPTAVKRLAHLWDVLVAAEPPVVLPELSSSGLWNVPGSMIYFPAHGMRRFIPLSQRVKRAYKGLASASRQKRIFHMWFHPTNLADETETMFAGLRAIFARVNELRGQYQVEVRTMGNLTVDHLSTSPVRETIARNNG